MRCGLITTKPWSIQWAAVAGRDAAENQNITGMTGCIHQGRQRRVRRLVGLPCVISDYYVGACLIYPRRP